MQPKLTVEGIPPLALKHAQILAFLGARPKDVTDNPLLYCAEIDYAVARLQAADDGTLLNFFTFIGEPLSNQQFTAWFFGREPWHL